LPDPVVAHWVSRAFVLARMTGVGRNNDRIACGRVK
jgi:hypothetical protein